LFFINYHFPLNNRVTEELNKLPFMCHMYRSSDLYDTILKFDSITDNALPETIIQDIREIDNVNYIMTLTIADDKIKGDIHPSFSLGNL
jgi:DNA-binding Lrp family transcriptional regulator